MESPQPTRLTPLRSPFRFSLRTLFILVTLFSIYLWWALDWKRQRHEFLKSHNATPVHHAKQFQQYLKAPVALWLVGEPGYLQILIYYPTEKQLKEGQRLFPEAKLMY